MNDTPTELLKARRDTLSELAERLSDEEYVIAERAIDLFLDIVEGFR